jgi:hypothetical protein
MARTKVPPGFAALVSERVRAAVALVERSVVPAYRVDATGEPEHEGSGVLVSYGGRFFFVSAAHVFDSLTGGVHLLIEGRSQHALGAAAKVSLRPQGAPRTADTVDLGFVELTDAEVNGLGKDNFISLESPHDFTRHWSQRMFVVGLPNKLQRRDRASTTYVFNHFFYQGPEVSEREYSAAGLTRGRQWALTFDHRRIQSPTGTGGRPNMSGMSGGGIWLLEPYLHHSHEMPPPLIGFLAGTPPRNRKALFGSSVKTLIEMLEDHHKRG